MSTCPLINNMVELTGQVIISLFDKQVGRSPTNDVWAPPFVGSHLLEEFIAFYAQLPLQDLPLCLTEYGFIYVADADALRYMFRYLPSTDREVFVSDAQTFLSGEVASFTSALEAMLCDHQALESALLEKDPSALIHAVSCSDCISSQRVSHDTDFLRERPSLYLAKKKQTGDSYTLLMVTYGEVIEIAHALRGTHQTYGRTLSPAFFVNPPTKAISPQNSRRFSSLSRSDNSILLTSRGVLEPYSNQRVSAFYIASSQPLNNRT